MTNPESAKLPIPADVPAAFRLAHRHALMLLLASAVACAQSARADCTGDLGPDRPGFSTGINVLSPDCQELELGFQDTRDEAPSMRAITSPLLLYRVGVGQRWELRAAWDGLSWTDTAGNHQRAANDDSLGIKYRLFDGSPWAFSLLGTVSLPTGSRSLSSKGYDPALGLLWNRALDDKDSLSGTVQAASLSDGDQRIAETSIAIDFSRAFDSRWGGFIELYAAKDAGSPVANTFDGGITYLIGNNLQLDFNAGIGLNAAADDRFFGAGAAWRF